MTPDELAERADLMMTLVDVDGDQIAARVYCDVDGSTVIVYDPSSCSNDEQSVFVESRAIPAERAQHSRDLLVEQADVALQDFSKQDLYDVLVHLYQHVLTDGQVVDLAKDLDDDHHFDGITDHQLRWYVACCHIPDQTEEGWEHDLVSLLLDGPAIWNMARDELIIEAISYNEDAENTARRLRASLEDAHLVGWPPYRAHASDDGGGS